MALVQREHLVDELEGLDPIRLVEIIDLRDNRLGAAHAIPVGAERRIDAAERASIRTAERRMDRRIRPACTRGAEALPVVCAISAHREEIPHLAMQVAVEVHDQGRRSVVSERIVVPPNEPGDTGEIEGWAGAEHFEELRNGDGPLAVAGEIDRLP